MSDLSSFKNIGSVIGFTVHLNPDPPRRSFRFWKRKPQEIQILTNERGFAYLIPADVDVDFKYTAQPSIRLEGLTICRPDILAGIVLRSEGERVELDFRPLAEPGSVS